MSVKQRAAQLSDDNLRREMKGLCKTCTSPGFGLHTMQDKFKAFNKLYGAGGAFHLLHKKTANNKALVKEAKNACYKAWLESEGIVKRRPGTAPARQAGNVLRRVQNIEARRPISAPVRRPNSAPAPAWYGTGKVLRRVQNIEGPRNASPNSAPARRPNSAPARRPNSVRARRPNSAPARRPNSARARRPNSVRALLHIVAGLLPLVGGGPTVLVPHRNPDIVFNNRSPCWVGTRTNSHFQKP
jgi:hypothetical protein